MCASVCVSTASCGKLEGGKEFMSVCLYLIKERYSCRRVIQMGHQQSLSNFLLEKSEDKYRGTGQNKLTVSSLAQNISFECSSIAFTLPRTKPCRCMRQSSGEVMGEFQSSVSLLQNRLKSARNTLKLERRSVQ